VFISNEDLFIVRTQVGIIGAGPAGLLLSHLLHAHGIESVVLERRSQAYVEARVRAGMLEWGTAELLKRVGLGERMVRQGMIHGGFGLVLNGRINRLDLDDLTGGKSVTIYGQGELVKDMIQARMAVGAPPLFEATPTGIDNLDGDLPTIRFLHCGNACELTCDFVAGCDGYHGISRRSLPSGSVREFVQDYPLAWLGILAKAPVFAKELVYSPHERGFSLFSMRSPELSRAYLQCVPGEDLANWPDERIWSELRARLECDDGKTLCEGPIVSKNVTAMRSFVVEPMQYGRLFLAGDAAHVVPPSAAKGLNAAVADVALLAGALPKFYRQGKREACDH